MLQAEKEKDPEKGKKDRIEILQKSVPYMESITGKKYKNVDTNPFADKEFMLDISALGTYTPGYDDYIPPKSEEDEKITDNDKVVIQKFMVGENGKGGKKKEVLDILDKLEKDNQGSGPKEKAIRDEISKAKTDLEGVEAKNACDFKERTSLRQAKEDMESKISANKSILTKKDEEHFNEIIKKIEEIDNYCSQKSYRNTSEETKK